MLNCKDRIFCYNLFRKYDFSLFFSKLFSIDDHFQVIKSKVNEILNNKIRQIQRFYRFYVQDDTSQCFIPQIRLFILKINKIIKAAIQTNPQQMKNILKKRLFPNNSICLRPPTPHAPNDVLCNCQMCNQFQHKKKLELLNTQQAEYKKKIQQKLQSSLISSSLNCDSQAYQWLLNRLVLPSHKIINRGIDIYIPETLFYKDGEPIAIFMNKEIHDCRIKKIKKEKINQTMIQKIMNERRRKYRDQVQIELGQKVVQKKKSLFAKKQVRTDTKDAAVLQFGDRSQQLITQNQLINLMLKRKQDPIWRKITMIKNFISSRESSRLLKLSFNYDSPIYPQLFNRTKKLMLIYGDNIQETHKQYISQVEQQAFCRQLLKTSFSIFGEYFLYKIISFVQYFYDDRIDSIECAILVNQFQRVYLVDVFHIQKHQLVKYTWTQLDYQRKIQQEENRIFTNARNPLLDSPININPQTQNKSKNIESFMYDKYLVEKNKYGLTPNPEDTTEEQNNDKFFSFLYPQFKQNLSDVLRSENLSILDIKKKYLGYVEQKKPIVKPFASTFVTTLHSLTPQSPRDKKSPKGFLKYTFPNESHSISKTIRLKKLQTPLLIDKKIRSNYRVTLDYFY